MRTNAFRFPVLAAIIASAAIGASGPAFAACGVSSGGQTGIHPATVGTGVKSGVTGSTHGASPSACPSRTNATITTNGSILRGASGAGPHVYAHNSLTAAHHNMQTTNLQTPIGTTNKTAKKPKT